MMHKMTLNLLTIFFLLLVPLSAQEKDGKKDIATPNTKEDNVKKTSEVMEKTTTMSEKASPAKDIKVEYLQENPPVLKTPEKIKLSKEMLTLLKEREETLLKLNEADSEMNKLIVKSNDWDKERNTEKKGQLDTILDKADRLSFSNELRMKLSNQAKIISALIKNLNGLELKIKDQELADEKKRQMEAYKKHIEMLTKERKTLIEKLKNQNSETIVVNNTQAIQKKNAENVEYFTITEDTNLQNIALQYYQDHEKWTIIFDHPDNKTVLKKKSPTAIIPIGTVLTVPKLKEE